MIVTENFLDNWVNGNSEIAQGVIVKLVSRLVIASCPNPIKRRFPLGDSMGQPGADGILDTEFEFLPFIPQGKSYWEIGTGSKPVNKATKDYRELTAGTPSEERVNSTFIFVTPLSGRRSWGHTWNKQGIAIWSEKRRSKKEWKDVRVIDGTILIDWLHHFPAVELWLAEKMGLPANDLTTPEIVWDSIKRIGEPPSLIPELFLANREEPCIKLSDLFSKKITQLQLTTRYPDQLSNFVSAYIASLDEDERIEYFGNSLIISTVEAGIKIANVFPPHILIADFDIGDKDRDSVKFLELARRNNHRVVYAALPWGIPANNKAEIKNPKIFQIRENLIRAGYSEGRADILSNKSDGNLNFLLRCLQNLPIVQPWAKGANAQDLAIAELLGAWDENSEPDQKVIEEVSGKPFGEWTGIMRKTALIPGTPLIHREGHWKFKLRYEGWFALANQIYDDHLDKFQEAVIKVLSEIDPELDLPQEKRYAAKSYSFSTRLREGLSQALSLLGNHSDALSSATVGKAQASAKVIVRELLSSKDWRLWASLNAHLPLFAEAAPEEFLNAVDNALGFSPCPFDILYEQESSGIMGKNYMTGLLWGLEALAWESQYLNQTIFLLGELAVKDPGGNWSNRPANSLYTILLPWKPQTCASIDERISAIKQLSLRNPDVAWNLILEVLPSTHQITFGSNRPEWRQSISETWMGTVLKSEYAEQIQAIASMAVEMATQDLRKAEAIIGRLSEIPDTAFNELLTFFKSKKIQSRDESERALVWNALNALLIKHRKFADLDWAMPQEKIEAIGSVAKVLSPRSPVFIYQKLFGFDDFDLFEEKGDFDKQRHVLEEKRNKAIFEIFSSGGMAQISNFIEMVDKPFEVGLAFSKIENHHEENCILSVLFSPSNNKQENFAHGYILGKFQQLGWEWADKIDISSWTQEQVAHFFSKLPFCSETWNRAERLLDKNNRLYWKRTLVNPHKFGKELEFAIQRLLENNRPIEAVACLARMLHKKIEIDPDQAIRALKESVKSTQNSGVNTYYILEVINFLQNAPAQNIADIAQIEWMYLLILSSDRKASPKVLEGLLAIAPSFYCQVIRSIDRSKNDDGAKREPSEEDSLMAKMGYRLLAGWRTPPGKKEDGQFNGEELEEWIRKVKMECAKTGHKEVGQLMIGHILVYTPPDPNGLWLHHSAAKVLNERDAKNMRDGFRTELFNRRGVFTWAGGKEERQLAEAYRKMAEEVQSQGYNRLAATLRELAETYEYHADKEASRDPFDDF